VRSHVVIRRPSYVAGTALRAVLVGVGVALLAGCGNCWDVDVCNSCPGPLRVHFVDATTGGQVGDVGIDAEADCGFSGSPREWVCAFEGCGHFSFRVTAAGYLPADVSVDVPRDQCECCSCGAYSFEHIVELDPE